MAKPELGTKRLCGHCGVKFYDLSKDPIVCPKCHSVFEVAAVNARGRPEPAAARAAAPRNRGRGGSAGDRRGRVRLARGSGRRGAGQEAGRGRGDRGGEEDVELEDERMDDDTFIEEQEEGDEDVTDIIGDVKDEEET